MLLPSARDEACAPSAPNVGQTAALFSVLGPSTGPCPSAVRLSFCRRKEGSIACPFHSLRLAVLPLPPWPGPKAYPSCPSFHSRAPPGLGPDSLSCTRVRSTSPGSAPACHHCPLWSARMDVAVRSGGWLAGAGLLVLRPARDPGQHCRLPLTCAQGWFFSNEGQSPQRGNRL